MDGQFRSGSWERSIEIRLPNFCWFISREHFYQGFTHHRLEPVLRERDGFFVCLADKAALLVSVNARFGSAEQNELNELLADLSYGANPTKFVVSDWMFQTEKKEKTLSQIYSSIRI